MQLILMPTEKWSFYLWWELKILHVTDQFLQKWQEAYPKALVIDGDCDEAWVVLCIEEVEWGETGLLDPDDVHPYHVIQTIVDEQTGAVVPSSQAISHLWQWRQQWKELNPDQQSLSPLFAQFPGMEKWFSSMRMEMTLAWFTGLKARESVGFELFRFSSTSDALKQLFEVFWFIDWLWRKCVQQKANHNVSASPHVAAKTLIQNKLLTLTSLLLHTTVFKSMLVSRNSINSTGCTCNMYKEANCQCRQAEGWNSW